MVAIEVQAREPVRRTEAEPQYDYDVVVVGNGIAGAAAAKRLGERGLRVAIVDPRPSIPEKSLFINAEQLESTPGLLESLSAQGSLISVPNFRLINIDDNSKSATIDPTEESARTYGVYHRPLVTFFRAGFDPEYVTQMQARVVASKETQDHIDLQIRDGEQIKTISAKYVVDATGSYSSFSRKHLIEGQKEALLNDDPLVLWVRGFRVKGKFEPGALLDPIGKDIGLAWILPYSETEADIVSSDLCRISELNPQRQQEMVENLKRICVERGICTIEEITAPIVGFIRAEPIPASAAKRTKRVFVIGDAAGMGSPLVNEVIPAAIKWGTEVGDAIADGVAPRQFFRRWRKREQMFPYDTELGMVRRRLRHRARGEYGSNAPIYQTIIDYLPPVAQQEMLTTRRISPQYLPYLLNAAIHNPQFIPNIAEMGIDLALVKAQRIVPPRLRRHNVLHPQG